MAHLQYMPGDPRLVDQLVYELKSKGIFDQFRKECIADVDTRPAYQNLRQRVESSVSTFLSHQSWKPDMNKNQLREKLRKNILEGNYLEQGLERIVDQVVNPKVATVFKPQVEDLVYNFLGIARKKTTIPETLENKLVSENLLPTDLEAVSPGSVKSDEEKEFEKSSESKDETKMDVDEDTKPKAENNVSNEVLKPEKTEGDTQLSGISDLTLHDSDISLDKSNIPLPAEEINPENIPSPENSPPKIVKVELEKIELPKEPNLSTDIPLPDEILKDEKELYFKPINSEDSSSDSSLRRNMSPLTPIRNFINENSCDAQQAFENVSNERSEVTKEPSSFRFTIEKSLVSSSDELKTEKKHTDQATYQYNNQVNMDTFNTPLYDDSSNSNNLRIDYESDANSKTNVESKQTGVITSQNNQHGEETRKEQKNDEKKGGHKISHHSRDSHRHSSSSKDKRSDSKHSSSKDRKESKNDKKLSKDDSTRSKSSHSDKPKEKKDKKDSRDSSKHRSSSHNKSSSHKDSKSQRSSSTSSSHRHSSKHSDDKKTSSSGHKDRSDRSSDKTSKDKSSKDSKTTYRSDKDKKSSTNKNKQDDKEKKDKKDTDDHYSLSGRGNPNRRSTDRDSNDGSSSSKGSQNQPNSKSSENKNNKGTSSKSENTSTSNDSTSPSDNDHVVNETESETKKSFLPKPIIRIDSHLGTPVSNIPHLPFVPDVTLKKPKFAANLAEAKRLMKMRRFLAEEQRRMNQEAALLLEFQANVRPSLSQVYSSVPGPELEFVCGSNLANSTEKIQLIQENHSETETEAQVNYEAKEEMIIDGEIDIDLHKETAPSHNHEDSSNIMSQNDQIIHENHVYNEVSESSKHLVLEESYTPTIELTRTRINEIIGVESFTGNNTIVKEEELYSVNKNELHNETATKIKTMTLEDPEIHNFNKEEFTKEKINEIIGVDAFGNNFLVDNNTVLESEPNSAESVLIYDSDDDSKKRFEVTIINETVDDTNDYNLVDSKETIQRVENNIHDEIIDIDKINDQEESKEISENIIISDSEENNRKFFEVTIITEEISDEKENECSETVMYTEEKPLEYFGEQEKFNAEIEKEKFLNFLNTFNLENGSNKKIYLFNCDAYEKKVFKEVSENFGRFEIVNYHKNGCLKLTKGEKNITKNLRFNTEITLPVDKDMNNYDSGKSNSPLLSPTKSEYSFDLPNDYNAKLDEMMKKASKRDIMEIILGIPEESPSKEPRPDYSDSNLESEGYTLKRKLFEVEALDNNNKNVLTPNKIRKLSDSDQISSTTEETEGNLSNRSNNTRSKYLGKARRVGLPRPRRCTLPNSPSSDKSVENYEQNSMKTSPNGKLKATPRSKVQRYDTTDLYKPKLHYLSRRNNVS